MKQLSGFMVLKMDGGTRVSYTYTEINSETGEEISANNKESFHVVDGEMKQYTEGAWNYIQKNKLGE